MTVDESTAAVTAGTGLLRAGVATRQSPNQAVAMVAHTRITRGRNARARAALATVAHQRGVDPGSFCRMAGNDDLNAGNGRYPDPTGSADAAASAPSEASPASASAAGVGGGACETSSSSSCRLSKTWALTFVTLREPATVA